MRLIDEKIITGDLWDLSPWESWLKMYDIPFYLCLPDYTRQFHDSNMTSQSLLCLFLSHPLWVGLILFLIDFFSRPSSLGCLRIKERGTWRHVHCFRSGSQHTMDFYISLAKHMNDGSNDWKVESSVCSEFLGDEMQQLSFHTIGRFEKEQQDVEYHINHRPSFCIECEWSANDSSVRYLLEVDAVLCS